MKKLVLALLISSGLFAQNEPNLQFANTEQNLNYGGAINATLSATDIFGNTYLVGTFSNLADFDPSAAEANLTAIGSSDLFVSVYDSNGNYLATRHIGGTGTITPTGVAIAGGFVHLVGNYTNTIDFDPSVNVVNLTSINSGGSGFLAKYDLNGNFVACKSIDGTGTIAINDIKFFNNEVVIVGNLTGTMDFDPSVNTLALTANGPTDAFVAKYDASLLAQAAVSFGGTNNDSASSLALDESGNMIISGSYLGTVDFDPSAGNTILTTATASISHTYIAKYTNNGAFQWVKDSGGRSSTSSNSKLVLDSNLNILITGSFNQTSDFDPEAAIVNLTTAGQSDVFIAKYDVDGNYVWVKSIGSNGDETSRNIAIDTFNDIHIIGTFNGSVDFDPNAGVTNLISATGNNFFAKYDNNGSFIYANNLFATINSMFVDSGNALVLAGGFIGIRDFDPSAGTANLTSTSTNVFLAKYASDSAYIFAKPIGGDKPSNAVTNFIATDGTGNIYRAGLLSATTDLDPSAAIFNLSSLSAIGIYIAKYSSIGNSLLWAKSFSADSGSSLFLSIMNTDTNGNTYITGRFLGTVDFDPSANTANLTSNNGPISSFFMAKYDSNGNYLWAKQLGAFSAGAKRMLFDTVGNFYFAGRVGAGNPIDFDPSPATAIYTPQGTIDLVFAKYSPAGDYIWAKGIGGAASVIVETHFYLEGNSFYLSGFFQGSVKFNPATSDLIASSNGLNGYIAKYDLNGNYQFAYAILAETGSITATFNVVADDGNNFYLFTNLQGTADFDLLPTSTSIITSPTIGGNVTNSYVISKYSPTGGLSWAKSLNVEDGGINQNTVHAYLNGNELIVAFPFFTSGIDLDPSANDFIVNANPSKTNIIVGKYNTNTGDFIWGNKIDGDYNGVLNSTNFDSNANLLLSGSFTGTADFDFLSGVQNLTSSSLFNNDRFYAKYDSNTLGIEENNITKTYVIYPNPTNDILYVSHATYDEFNVTLMDITGKVLQKATLTNQKGVDVSSYTQGMYFIQIDNGLEKSTYKFLKK